MKEITKALIEFARSLHGERLGAARIRFLHTDIVQKTYTGTDDETYLPGFRFGLVLDRIEEDIANAPNNPGDFKMVKLGFPVGKQIKKKRRQQPCQTK